MADNASSAGFRPAMRIRQAREFQRIRAHGGRLVKGCLIANWLVRPSGGTSRAAFIASRKIGRAHVRNRARRLLREAFRLHRREFRKSIDLILVARASIKEKAFASVEQDFMDLMREARLVRTPA